MFLLSLNALSPSAGPSKRQCFTVTPSLAYSARSSSNVLFSIVSMVFPYKSFFRSYYTRFSKK